MQNNLLYKDNEYLRKSSFSLYLGLSIIKIILRKAHPKDALRRRPLSAVAFLPTVFIKISFLFIINRIYIIIVLSILIPNKKGKGHIKHGLSFLKIFKFD